MVKPTSNQASNYLQWMDIYLTKCLQCGLFYVFKRYKPTVHNFMKNLWKISIFNQVNTVVYLVVQITFKTCNSRIVEERMLFPTYRPPWPLVKYTLYSGAVSLVKFAYLAKGFAYGVKITSQLSQKIRDPVSSG